MKLATLGLAWAIAAVPAVAEDAHKGAVDAIVNDGLAIELGNIKSLYAEKWPTDFSMQKYCLDESRGAYVRAQAFDVMATKENTTIWATCAQRWSDGQDRVDWSMMAYCIDEQATALEALR